MLSRSRPVNKAVLIGWIRGFYDSGYIQTLDFFGDGTRIPLIAVSPFSRGGRVVHDYADHPPS